MQRRSVEDGEWLLQTFNAANANRELYKFLHRKLTVKLKSGAVTTVKAGDGFELYRYLCKKLDHVSESSKHVMLAEIRRLAFYKAKNVVETKAMIVRYLNACRTYTEKTCLEVSEEETTMAIWMFMDEDSKALAEKKGRIGEEELIVGESSFQITSAFIESIIDKDAARNTLQEYSRKQGSPDAMDLSAVSMVEPAAAEPPNEDTQPQPQNESEGFNAFSGACYGCGGFGHRQDQCTSKEGR